MQKKVSPVCCAVNAFSGHGVPGAHQGGGFVYSKVRSDFLRMMYILDPPSEVSGLTLK